MISVCKSYNPLYEMACLWVGNVDIPYKIEVPASKRGGQ